MALIDCPQCGKRISDTAIQCPHCGARKRKSVKKIYFTFIGIFSLILGIILISAICATCTSRGSEVSNYSYSEDTTSYDNTTAIQTKLDELKKMPELQNYKALYETVDKNGKSFNIYITKEKSVVVTTSDAEVLYCTFNDYKENPYIEYDYEIRPSEGEVHISFNGGGDAITYFKPLIIKDNWLYLSQDKAEANNPNWRLPLKIKKGLSRKTDRVKTGHSDSGSKQQSTERVQQDSEELSEEEITKLETIMYGYNEAAWRAKARKDARNR